MNARQASSIRLGILRARKEIDHHVVLGDLPNKLAWKAHTHIWHEHHRQWLRSHPPPSTRRDAA